ncbi:hypothetical protein GGR51DRAFT_500507 [Nemania sp. FL0031]|nr:hypothetical protein GGR51DRAFT_500507 [Nemania sp. FL0031]
MRHMGPTGVAQLKVYWTKHLPMEGHVLDFNSSGDSWLPLSYGVPIIQGKLRVSMCAPDVRILKNSPWRWPGVTIMHANLNDNPADSQLFYLAKEQQLGDYWKYDTIVNLLNAHCIQLPLVVFGGLWRMTKTRGCIHLVVGENCLDESMAAQVYLRNDGRTKVAIMCDFLHLAG